MTVKVNMAMLGAATCASGAVIHRPIAFEGSLSSDIVRVRLRCYESVSFGGREGNDGERHSDRVWCRLQAKKIMVRDRAMLDGAASASGAVAVVAESLGVWKFGLRGSGVRRSRRAGEVGMLWSPDSAKLERLRCVSVGASPVRRLVEEASKVRLRGSEIWTEKIVALNLGKAIASIASSAAFYFQAAASAIAEELVDVSDSNHKSIAFWGTIAVVAFLYFLVIPAIVYNYLRLRWYKRKLAETFFQFLLVFLFFPGMLLLAPFINFRRLPKEGTKPP